MILSVSEYLLTRFRFALILSILFLFDIDKENLCNYNIMKEETNMFKKLKYVKFSHFVSIFLMIIAFFPAMLTKIFVRDFGKGTPS